ncbi:hypothetical protein D0S48_04505 [Psychrobacillus sp. AK 1817]|nr:hypothetical protein D0S48_04505 [Psychrobacillus sp. AK 1817]
MDRDGDGWACEK